MTPITLRQLSKRFDAVVAVDAVNLEIAAGELFFLLGPSGCGKTTLLRMIAGFTDPSEGSIHFGDQDVTHLPANRRNAGMVFQGYALWPHMTVAQNVAFGLDVRRMPAASKTRRVDAALEAVQLANLAHRKPNELSGGQQQRVALARALVIEPTVLLLDEPLSNLDAKLRLEMRTQIRDICKRAGITAIYVTHDQKEALSMADRIALMRNGQVVQAGKPRELYAQPVSRFVADFLGESNFIPGRVLRVASDAAVVETAAGLMRSSVYPAELTAGSRVVCSLRPEAVRLARPGAPVIAPAGFSTWPVGEETANMFTARRTETIYLGDTAQHHVHLSDAVAIKVLELNPPPISDDLPLTATFDPKDVVILRN